MLTGRSRSLAKMPVAASLLLIASYVFITFVALDGPPARIQAEQTQPYTISVDVGLVILPVFVTDRRGRAVAGLQAHDFHLYEDGRQRQITLFEPEDVPATIGLVIDNSRSMNAKREEVAAAGLEFARSSNPRDEIFVVNFNQDVSFGLPKGVPFTGSVPVLRNALATNAASGGTALYDGLAAALAHLKAGTRERKALIVVSDGGDNASRITLPELLNRIEASNVVIDTIGIFDPSYVGENPNVLKRLAKMTGGNSYFPTSAGQVTADCKEIAADVRHQYTLGYSAEGDQQGTYHAIRVTAASSTVRRLHVRTRAGFVIESQTASLTRTEGGSP